MTATRQMSSLKVGIVSISDRASAGVYEDQGIPALKEWFDRALQSPWRIATRLIPDERPQIEAALKELAGNAVERDMRIVEGLA